MTRVSFRWFGRLPDARYYLEPGMTFPRLDDITHAMSDNEVPGRRSMVIVHPSAG